MAFSDDDAMECRLGEFLNGRIGQHLARREQKEPFALYAHGILSDGERKSVEPIAARATGGGEEDEKEGAACERMQARLSTSSATVPGTTEACGGRLLASSSRRSRSRSP
jgi:hypothetical protein